MTDEPVIPIPLRSLFAAVCDETATEQQIRELEGLVRSDEQVRRLYLAYCELHINLYFAIRDQRTHQAVCEQLGRDAAEPLAVLRHPVLSTSSHGLAGYFSSGWPVAYLVATVILSLGLLIGGVVHVSQPTDATLPSIANGGGAGSEGVDLPSPFGRGAGGEGNASSVVGRITGMVDCVWEKEGLGDRDWGLDKAAIRRGRETGNKNQKSQITNHKSLVALGDTLALRSGLLEITYDTGAKVILQGPVTYEVNSAAGGYLAVGKLTARLEKKAEGGRRKAEEASRSQSPFLLPPSTFVITTPTAIVTDLGTEFGVEVNAQGRADVHVFAGVVDCRLANERIGTQTVRLRKDSSASFLPDGSVIKQHQADRSRFAMIENVKTPHRQPLHLVGLYTFDGNAEDQSGNGNHVSASKMNGITFVDGMEGQSAHFDAAGGSFVDLPIDASPTAMPKLTWGVWVRPRKIGPDRGEILSTDIFAFGRTLTIDDRGRNVVDSPNDLRFSTFLGNEGPDRGIFSSTGPLPREKTWTFVAGVYNESLHRVSIYVEDKNMNDGNGGLAEEHTIGAIFGKCNSSIRVGRHAKMVEAFDGEIDNIFIFADVLNTQELETIRVHGVAGIKAIAQGKPAPSITLEQREKR